MPVVSLIRVAAVLVVLAAGIPVAVEVTDTIERGSGSVWLSVASWGFAACLWGLIFVGVVAVWRRRG